MCDRAALMWIPCSLMSHLISLLASTGCGVSTEPAADSHSGLLQNFMVHLLPVGTQTEIVKLLSAKSAALALSAQRLFSFLISKVSCFLDRSLTPTVTSDLWCAFALAGPHQAGDALLAAAAAAETLGVQQHPRRRSQRQLELPDLGLPPYWPRGQRQW